MNIWPWSKIAALEAELDEAIETIIFLQDEIEETDEKLQRAGFVRGGFSTSPDTFPASGIGEA